MTVYLVGNQVMLKTPNQAVRNTGVLVPDDDYPERTWYISRRTRKIHWFRNRKGWGIAIEIIGFLERNNVYGVKLPIDNTDTPREEVCKQEVERSSLPMIRLHGFEETYPPHEPQLIIPERHWLTDGQAML